MTTTIVMPRFGATMEEGIVSYWAVKEGDLVTKGDVLGEIEIEKLSNELVAEEDGVVLKIIAEEGVAIACGQPIMILGQAGEVVSLQEFDNEILKEQPASKDNEPIIESSAELKQQSEPGKVTPKAQELADELGADTTQILGTGRLGMITRDDVRVYYERHSSKKAVRTSQAQEQPEAIRKMTSMEMAVSQAMETSLRNTAQTTLSFDLDASHLVDYYQKEKQAAGISKKYPTYTAIFIKIIAQALESHPLLRTVIQANQLIAHSQINIGVAIDVGDGLVVPVIKDANKKSFHQINVELHELKIKANKHLLSNEDITGGVFTITNLGTYGIKYFTPIINPGETAILGIGVLQNVAVIENGGIYIKPVFSLSLTHDHRVVNGAPAARFLQTIQSIANEL